MNKARIENTNEIVTADTLLRFYPNYDELVFVCIDKKCSIRMAPACIKKTEQKKPHFKKYRNREHVETCEYATLNELYQKGKNQNLSKIEINKIGYPSVFNSNEIKDEELEKIVYRAKLDEDGMTGRGGGLSKVYEFDSENIKFDRSNKVQSIDRIVDWYLGFPYNRDVEIEINNIKIPYRYFFKRIGDYTDPISLKNDRIFYGKVMLSNTNKNVFSKYPDSVFFTLLGFKMKDELEDKIYNYSIRIDKKTLSNNKLARLRNKYNALFEVAYTDFKRGSNEPGIGLYVFVYGAIDEKIDTLLHVKQHHITFRYDEVRKTMHE